MKGYRVHKNDLLDVLRDVVSYYLFNEEQVLILSNKYKGLILEDNLIKELGKRIVDLDNNYNVKEIIKNLLSNLQERTGKTIISKVDLIDRNTNKKHNLLMKINRLFNNSNNDDICLINKYTLTKKRINENHPYQKYYRTYRIKKPFKNYTYNQLKEACNKILSSDLSTVYIKHRRFIDNEIFKCLKYPLDYELINGSISILNTIIDNKEIDYSLALSKYTEDFMEALLAGEIINTEYLVTLTNTVNLKYNNELLNKSAKKKWGIFFNKHNRRNDEHNAKIFSSLREDIYEEYIKNYNSISILKEKLSFLKCVMDEGKFDEEITDIIKNENVYEKLSFYKKIFETTYHNKDTFILINKISKIEEDILKYCYDDLEEKKEID
ncbi:MULTISPECIES: hypothetical protein, partial [Clostridium]|uniref:hypothetical protein n=1 Tax=Clostridium TaxID=1485 RepID=UPI002941CA4D